MITFYNEHKYSTQKMYFDTKNIFPIVERYKNIRR